MAENDSKSRNDFPARMTQSRSTLATVVLGESQGTHGRSATMQKPAAMPENVLGRYEVKRELGKGAMGVVYLGRDLETGREVAIKTMSLSLGLEPDELEEVKARFFREAESAGRLNHQNIVRMHDAGEEGGLACLVMELLKGGDLVSHAAPDALLPLPRVLDIAARVADALGYAHTLHIVHRDIKPANIMYDPATDTVKVTDFGVARITDSSRTKTGMVLGTPSYMSPEQLCGKKIEGASDLFSLGVTLYQLVCGRLPFEGDSLTQLMSSIVSEPHIDIASVRAAVPPCVVEIINRALAKKPEDRYASGNEMARALRQCAASLEQNTSRG